MPASGIVVVHNNRSFLDATVAALRRAGYDAIGFSGGIEALKVITAARAVDVLVTRIRFGEGQPNGISLGLMTRRQHKAVKIIFTTQDDMAEYARDVGSVLLAPVTPDAVVEKVTELLASPSPGVSPGENRWAPR